MTSVQENETNNQMQDLTPNQQQEAKKRAYEAFVQEYELRHGAPETKSVQEVMYQEDTRIRKVLMNLSLSSPLLILVVFCGALVVSFDKTSAIFTATSTYNNGFVGIAGFLMVECFIVFSAFGEAMEHLRQNTKPRRFSLVNMGRGFLEFVGVLQPPHDTHTGTGFIVKALILVSIAMSTYATLLANETGDYTTWDFVIAWSIGASVPILLHHVGTWFAQIASDIFRFEHEKINREFQVEHKRMVFEAWQEFEAERTAQELHRAYTQKNKVSIHTPSHYLPTGESEVMNQLEGFLMPLPTRQPVQTDD